MKTNYALVNHVMNYTGLSAEQAMDLTQCVIGYLQQQMHDPTLRDQLTAIASEPADRHLLQQLFAALLPPFIPTDVQMVAEVLEEGMDVNCRHPEGATPLHVSVALNRVEMVQLLLVRGANPNLLDQHEQTPLQLLAEIDSPNAAIATLLLAAGAQPDIGVACVLGDSDQVQAILAENPAAIHLGAGVRREAPLHRAAAHGHTAITTLLLEAGADVQAGNQRKMTPLHWAAAHQHGGVVEVLLQHGANPNVQADFGATPLDMAVKFGGFHAPVAELLRQHGSLQRLQTRLLPWEAFRASLQRHYAQVYQSEVELAFSEEGNCITRFNLWPVGKAYCIPKVHPNRGAAFQDEALAALKEVFFPEEAVRVRTIQQGQPEGHVLLEVEVLDQQGLLAAPV